MPVTLDATKSGTAANSYVTAAEADDWFNTLYASDDWLELDADTRARILIAATRAIDELPVCYGKAVASQARAFPVLKDGNEDGWQQAVRACLAQAEHIMRFNETILGARAESIQNVTQQQLGKVNTQKSTAGLNPFKQYASETLRCLMPFLNFEMTTGRG